MRYYAYREDVGNPVVYYASRDAENWATEIDQALQWHRHNENSFTPKAEHHEIYSEIEQGISDFSNYVATHQSLIRRLRNKVKDPEQHVFWLTEALTDMDGEDYEN